MLKPYSAKRTCHENQTIDIREAVSGKSKDKLSHSLIGNGSGGQQLLEFIIDARAKSEIPPFLSAGSPHIMTEEKPLFLQTELNAELSPKIWQLMDEANINCWWNITPNPTRREKTAGPKELSVLRRGLLHRCWVVRHSTMLPSNGSS